jgi:hypothetical protein
MVGHLPSKCKALGSIPEKKKKKEKERKEKKEEMHTTSWKHEKEVQIQKSRKNISTKKC